MQQHNIEVSLWMKFQKGDEHAFSQLYKCCYQKLYSYGVNIGLTDAQVRDGIQDLFMKLYTKKIMLADSSSIYAYLYRSIKNYGINVLAKSKKHTGLEEMDTPFSFGYTIDDALSDKENLQELKQKVDHVMSCLSSRQKEIIYLRFLDEMSYEQISFVLGITRQSARNLLHRAIEKMRTVAPEGGIPLIIIYCHLIKTYSNNLL